MTPARRGGSVHPPAGQGAMSKRDVAVAAAGRRFAPAVVLLRRRGRPLLTAAGRGRLPLLAAARRAAAFAGRLRVEELDLVNDHLDLLALLAGGLVVPLVQLQ